MENFFKICKEKLNDNSELHRNGQYIIWTGYRKNGYGQFRFKDSRSPGSDYKTRCVHRMSLMVDIQNLGRERSGRVFDSRPKGHGFEPQRRHCVVVLEQDTFILA